MYKLLNLDVTVDSSFKGDVNRNSYIGVDGGYKEMAPEDTDWLLALGPLLLKALVCKVSRY